MRKFILFFIFLLTLVSCEKMPEVDATLSFKPVISYNNNVSKLDANIIHFIDGKVSVVNIYLTNADTVYTCKSNESITVPFGLYEIYSEYIPTDVKNGCSSKPWLKSDTLMLNVRNSQSLSIGLEYICSIFIQENEYYEHAVPKKDYIDYSATYSNNNEDVTFYYDDGFNYNYIFTIRDSIAINNKTLGYDWSKNTPFKFGGEDIEMKNGRCYIFSPINNGRDGFNYSTIDI